MIILGCVNAIAVLINLLNMFRLRVRMIFLHNNCIRVRVQNYQLFAVNFSIRVAELADSKCSRMRFKLYHRLDKYERITTIIR